jgi:hypothetical protein
MTSSVAATAAASRRAAILALALLAACAGHLPVDATPRQTARWECEDFMARAPLTELRRGTALWDQALGICIAQHLGPAGEIDRTIASN